jgi:hypothetical protein
LPSPPWWWAPESRPGDTAHVSLNGLIAHVRRALGDARELFGDAIGSPRKLATRLHTNKTDAIRHALLARVESRRRPPGTGRLAGAPPRWFRRTAPPAGRKAEHEPAGPR